MRTSGAEVGGTLHRGGVRVGAGQGRFQVRQVRATPTALPGGRALMGRRGLLGRRGRGAGSFHAETDAPVASPSPVPSPAQTRARDSRGGSRHQPIAVTPTPCIALSCATLAQEYGVDGGGEHDNGRWPSRSRHSCTGR